MADTAPQLLIVDDDRDLALLLSEILELEGYAIDVAEDGETALQQMSKGLPDLVLLDVMMPSIDGFQVCQQIRDNPQRKALKVVFLSALTRDLDIAKGNTLGADAYITKPFSNADVVRQVKDLLSG